MNTLMHWTAVAALGATALALPFFHAPSTTAQDASASRSSDETRSDDARARALIEQLGSPDFDERDRAIQQLRDLGKPVLGALDAAASDSDDPEIRWNARRLARDIRDGVARPRSAAAPRSQGSRGGLRTPDLSELNDLQRELTAMRERIEKQMRAMQERMPVAPFDDLGGLTLQGGAAKGFTLQLGPDKVRVTTRTQNEDGSVREETYEADSMEQFREKYPEIASQYLRDGSPGSGLRLFRGAPGENSFQLDLDAPRTGRALRLRPTPQVPVEPNLLVEPRLAVPFAGGLDPADAERIGRLIGEENGELLGVGVELVPAAVAKFVGIDEGRGFVVTSVSEDSQAASMGLREGDLVVSIGGKAIGEEGPTIREALASVAPGEILRIEVIRGAEGRKVFEAKKRGPAAEKAEPAPEPAKRVKR